MPSWLDKVGVALKPPVRAMLPAVRGYPLAPLRRRLVSGRADWLEAVPDRLRHTLDLDGELISPLRIEIGSGEDPTPGYVHVDANWRAKHLEHIAPAWKLPFADGQAQELLAIHVLEHVHPGRLEQTLAEWRRVLRPDGFAQIHVPNAEVILRAYQEGDWSTKWYAASAVFGAPLIPEWSTASADRKRHWPDHQALYDFDLLREALTRAGFARVEDLSAQITDRHTAGWAHVIPGMQHGGARLSRDGLAIRDVEISIVNHDDRVLVRNCLKSIVSGGAGLDWHATVILNLASAGTDDLVVDEAGGQVSLAVNAQPMGFGANHNHVLRQVLAMQSARHVLVLNDDVLVDEGAIATLVDYLDAHPEVGAVVPTIRRPNGAVQHNRLAYPSSASSLRFDLSGQTEPPDPSGWLQGCCLLLRVEALRAAGVFDEQFFMFYEDVDLSRRLQDAGWSLASCPAASVTHLGHATVLRPDLLDSTLRRGRRSRYLYFAKHHGRVRATAMAYLGRAALLGRGLAALAHGMLARSPEAVREARGMLALARFDPRRATS